MEDLHFPQRDHAFPHAAPFQGVNYLDERSPLAPHLQVTPWPANFRAGTYPKYNGSTDPAQYIMSYQVAVASSGGDDATMAKSFIIALEGPALTWFTRLPPLSIDSWRSLRDKFLLNFQGYRPDTDALAELSLCKQLEKETLREYYRKFLTLKSQLPSVDDQIAIHYAISGLRAGVLYSHCIRDPPKNLQELYQLFEKYAKSEELHQRKVESQRKPKDAPQSSRTWTMRDARLRLNPEKCVFGVRQGKILGYLVSHRGIEANPTKIQAIINMTPPQSARDVQRLTGRLAALNRFISKSAERSLPFLKTLRGAKDFAWGPEQAAAFASLKQYLSELAVLTSPDSSLPLLLYVAASPHAVSAALVQEQTVEGVIRQCPVYYVSEVLTPSKCNMTELEKIANAVVMFSRKLRHYFEAFKVRVTSDRGLGELFRNPEASIRIAKWAAELSGYHINFEPRTGIKSQVLADFVVD